MAKLRTGLKSMQNKIKLKTNQMSSLVELNLKNRAYLTKTVSEIDFKI